MKYKVFRNTNKNFFNVSKKLLLILIALPMIGFGQQQTYVPDDLFEDYLENNGMGNGIPNDDYVTTANIDWIDTLDFNNVSTVSDLTGLEDFIGLIYLRCQGHSITSINITNNIMLQYLDCFSNQLTTLDVSQNTALTYLDCSVNPLTTLDVSNNTLLTELWCYDNQLTSLDVSNNTTLTYLVLNGNYDLPSLDLTQNTALTYLDCGNNDIMTSLDVSNNTLLTELWCDECTQLTSLDVSGATALEGLFVVSTQLTSLDVSNNIALKYLDCIANLLTSLDLSNNVDLRELDCQVNQLTSLDVRSGNNSILYSFKTSGNPNLTCIAVDNPTWSTANWMGNDIDPQHYFSNNCSGSTAISETKHTSKSLLKTTDILGKETPQKPNTPLFYMYDDGTVEKRIVIEK
ncbi:MAG: leucine-rich repeat domain-containing protein [Flavobacteriales bacterium]|nr:leucine-rich repeat domain-containing protein [Flavobacteriales bacterium]